MVMQQNRLELMESWDIIDNEEILWVGKPSSPFRFTIFSGGIYNIPYLSIWVIMLVFSIMLSIIVYQDSYFLDFVFMILIVMLIFLAPDFVKLLKQKFTRYYVLKSKIAYNFGGFKDYFIEISDIKSFEVEQYSSKKMTIHFITPKPVFFKTYRFSDLKERKFLTFEFIENGQEVIDLLKELGVKGVPPQKPVD